MQQELSVHFAILAFCTFAIVYSYFVYPIILIMFRRRRTAVDILDNENRQPISLIITVHNEESSIGRKLDETVQFLDELPELEIIVASDGSSDGTDSIVSKYPDVRLVPTDTRAGKENAQKNAIESAKGDILIFSDVATSIDIQSMQRILQVFGDPTVGAISSRDRIRGDDGTENAEGLYVRYEMWLRKLESELAGLVGLSGSFFAARRVVCSNWDTTIPSDFVVAINTKLLGFRSVADDNVVGTYADISRSEGEFARKTRTIIRGMTALWKKREILNVTKYRLFSFQVWSHKFMRWAVPWFGIGYSVTAIILTAKSSSYFIFLVPVLLSLAIGMFATVLPSIRKNTVIRTLYFFIMTNAAVLFAGALFLAGKRITMWSPTLRT